MMVMKIAGQRLVGTPSEPGEISKMLLSPSRGEAVRLMEQTCLLAQFNSAMAGLREVNQLPHHQEDALEHTIMVLENLPADASFALVWAALWHDLGKFYTQADREGGGYTFHKHEEVSATWARREMELLNFPNDVRDEVEFLILNHMRTRNVSEMRQAKVNTLFLSPYIENLLLLLEADDKGRIPFKDSYTEVRNIYNSWRETYRDVKKDLGINGHMVMEYVGLNPGPLVGHALAAGQTYLGLNPDSDVDEILAHIKGFIDEAYAAAGA